MEINAAAIKRPKTNLTVNPAYQLDRQAMKAGFMGVFNWAYSGDARKTLLKLALAPMASTAGIPLGKRPAPKNAEQRQARKAENTQLRAWAEMRSKMHLEQYTKLRKVNGTDPYFLLHLPMFIARDANDIASIFFMFTGALPDDDAMQSITELFNGGANQKYAPQALMQRSGLPGPTLDIFKPTLLGAEYEFGSTGLIGFLTFKITKPEAQALVSTDWMEIRPVDMYPLFSMWVEAEYISKFYSKSVVSLSRIAATLPKHNPADERIDEYGLGVDLDGDPLWIPRQCNNTEKYESMFAASTAGSGDTFALRTPLANSEPKLPENIPILVDWVNCKFAYSNSSGKPVIMRLEHVRKCNASMALNILRRPMPMDFITRLMYFAEVANLSTSARAYGADVTGSIHDYFTAFYGDQVQKDRGFYMRFLDLTSETEFAELAPVLRFVRAVYAGVMEHIDAFYAKYAVSTAMQHMGMLGLIVKYGADMAKTRVGANTIREKALKQGLDPNWTPPEMPLITAKFDTPEGGMLPHQARIRNILKDSPEHAVLSVDAGGGKSMLSITDILYEIKAGRSAPYLIMCPSHLVANYVAELVEFTDGQVNVVPVTSYNIRTSGLERYEEILRTAPINTVLVVDYDVLKFRAKAMGYGTASVAVYPVIEMIRQFEPGYVMMDESHFLRNTKSARTRTVLTLVADIKKKRIASGTLNPDSPSDLAGQMAILDPSIFGSRDNFNATYGEDVRGNRVMKWRTKGANSIGEVLPTLRQNVVWAQAKRKEWACALPDREDFFVSVELTPAQRQMYDAIFDDMIQQIRKDAETNKNAKKLLDTLTGKGASASDEEDFGDLGDEQVEEDDILDDSSDIGPALQPYLADIERFVTDPASHPYSKNGIILSNGEHVPPLTGDDLRPPKSIALEEVLRRYFANFKSKALVFVNYNQSAESLFNSMPEDLRSQGMLYSASQKTELVNRFKKDDSIRWMIGIRKSLEVGLNLQVAGCLIRCEGVWNPGEQEQGDSRIARPYFGPGGDKRDKLEFYTLVANRTIDITKAARLRAKIVALAKFENTGNPAYESIEDIPIIPMNLVAIQTQNDFSTNLEEYQQSMARLNQVIKEEYAEYREKIMADGGFHFTQVKRGPLPGGAAMLSRVPYAQGTELYKASELGLVRVDNYLGTEMSGDDEEEEGGDESGVENDVIAQQRKLLVGMRAHCEFGDGEIIGAAALGSSNYVNRLAIRLDDGTTVQRLRSTNVFVVTRTETNSIDMRNKLAQAAGMDVTAPITVPGVFVKQTKFSQRELREQEREKERQRILEQKKILKKAEKINKAIDISLQLQLVNGYLRFSYLGEDARTTKALEAVGFRMDQPYYYTRIRSYRHLLKQATMWAESGFETTNQVDNDALAMLAHELSKGGLQTHRHYQRLTSASGFRNYLRTMWKPSANKKLLNMFALITDGGADDPGVIRQAEKQGVDPSYAIAYLCLPMGAGHPGSRLAINSKFKAPGTIWYQSTPTLSVFVSSLAAAKHVLQNIRAAGISVNNVDELNKAARSMKRIAPKTDEVDMSDDDIPDDEEVKPVKKGRKPAR